MLYKKGNREKLDAAITLGRKANEVAIDANIDYSLWDHLIPELLLLRFEIDHKPEDMEDALHYFRSALETLQNQPARRGYHAYRAARIIQRCIIHLPNARLLEEGMQYARLCNDLPSVSKEDYTDRHILTARYGSRFPLILFCFSSAE